MSKSYLVARAGGLHFRIRIPADLQHLFRRLELRRSLSCLSRHHARAEAQRLACLSLDFFERLRAMSEGYSVGQLQEIVDRWLNERLRDTVREYRAARRLGSQLPEPALRDPEQLEVLSGVVMESLESMTLHHSREAKRAYDRWEPAARELAQEADLDFDGLTPDLQERLIYFTARAEMHYYSRLAKHSPFFDEDFWGEQQPRQPLYRSPPVTKPAAPTLEEAWTRCVDHYRAQGQKSWEISEADEKAGARASKNQHAKWLREDLFDLWGPDLPISEITWERLEELRDCFQFKYPASRKRKLDYRDKTLREIVDGPEVPEEDRIRGSTKDAKFRLAKDFFRFLRTHPSTKSHFKDDADQVLKFKADPLSTYEPWTLAELKTILESEEVHSRFLRRGPKFHPGGMFWLLTMLVYTGARQQEIMGLRPEDVELDREYPVIRIRKHQYRPSVKTGVSERWIPLHKDLLALGLADWIEFRVRLRQQTLWPVTDRGSNYWADRFREDITKPLGLHDGRKKVMHSFRGTFDSVASHVMPEAPRRLMTGHVGEGTDFRHYIRQLDHFIPKYSDYINGIDFQLDLHKLEALWRESVNRASVRSRR